MTKQVQAAHILVKTKEEALGIAFDLGQGKDFAELAKAKSNCPSSKKGGELGWFGRGQMVKKFETACFSMQKGEISSPIQTQFGWHIIKVLDTK